MAEIETERECDGDCGDEMIIPAEKVLQRFDTVTGDIRYIVDSIKGKREKKKSVIEYGGKVYEVCSARTKNLGAIERESLFDKLTLPYLRGEEIELSNFTELFYVVYSLHKVGYQLARKELENLVRDCPDFERVLVKASRRVRRKAGKKFHTLKYVIKHPLSLVPSNTSREAFKNNGIVMAFSEIQKEIITEGIPVSVDLLASLVSRRDVAKIVEMTVKLGTPIIFNLIFRIIE